MHKQQPWQKKGDTTFDVIMGSYDGAEVPSFPNCRNSTSTSDFTDTTDRPFQTPHRETENIKKEICRVFNHNGLRITIEANKQTINFLDITFNLNKNTYQPFTKPNTTLQYVHRESNHPPTSNNIPTGINKRLSFLSSDKASFNQAKKKKALDECGYQYTLHYEPATTNNRKNRQWNNILWYNPPIQQKRQHQYRTQIPCPSRQALPERPQT